MFKVTVEGIYESITGNAQSKHIPFNLVIEVARMKKEGIETHLEKRLIPYFLKTEKKYKDNLFSKIKHYRIVDIEKLDKECELFGKEVMELSELEIQQLATLYDLYEAPLYGVYPLTTTREKTAIAYFKKVIKVPLKTVQDKQRAEFLVQTTDGSFIPKFDGIKTTIIENKEFFNVKPKEMNKKISTDSYFEAIEKKNNLFDGKEFELEKEADKDEIDDKLNNLGLE